MNRFAVYRSLKRSRVRLAGNTGGLSGGFFGALGENFGTPKNAGGGGGLVQSFAFEPDGATNKVTDWLRRDRD